MLPSGSISNTTHSTIFSDRSGSHDVDIDVDIDATRAASPSRSQLRRSPLSQFSLKPLQPELSRLFRFDDMRTLIICDTGKDDAIMLIQAVAHSDQLNLSGVIASSGNVGLNYTVANTQFVLQQCKANIPVFEGMKVDEEHHEANHAAHVHGLCGLGTYNAEEINQSISGLQPAIPLDAEKVALSIAQHSGQTTLICTSPMQDLSHILKAVVERDMADISERLRVVLMAGVFDLSQANIGKSEFNVHYQAQLASDVIEMCYLKGIPVLIAPLDLTHLAPVELKDLQRLTPLKNNAAKLMRDLYEGHISNKVEAFFGDPERKFQPLHDVHAVTCLIKPSLYQGSRIRMHINPRLGQDKGLCEALEDPKANVFVLSSIDRQGFIDCLFKDIESYETNNSLPIKDDTARTVNK